MFSILKEKNKTHKKRNNGHDPRIAAQFAGQTGPSTCGAHLQNRPFSFDLLLLILHKQYLTLAVFSFGTKKIS
jgi:hypothetical protein